MLQTDNRSRLDSAWMGEQSQGGLTIGVFGALDQQDVPLLRRIAHHTSSSLAFSLDVDAWAGGRTAAKGATHAGSRAGGRGSAPVLTSAGWRAVHLGPQDRMDSAWEELGRMSSSRGSTTAPAARA